MSCVAESSRLLNCDTAAGACFVSSPGIDVVLGIERFLSMVPLLHAMR